MDRKIKIVLGGMVAGNTIAQLYCANIWSRYFMLSLDDPYFVIAAQQYMAVMVSSGAFTRLLILYDPRWTRGLMYIGLCLWLIGAFVVCFPLPFPSTVNAVYLCMVAPGSGIFYWASYDTRPFVLTVCDALYSCISYLYVLGVVMRLISGLEEGAALYVNRQLILMIAPFLAVFLYFDKAPKMAIVLKEPGYSKRAVVSTLLNFVFIVLLSVYTLLPSVSIAGTMQVTYTQEQLFLTKVIAIIAGQLLESVLHQYTAIPVVASIIVPIILGVWNITDTVLVLFLYGACVGIQSSWSITRATLFFHPDKMLFIAVLCTVPGMGLSVYFASSNLDLIVYAMWISVAACIVLVAQVLLNA